MFEFINKFSKKDTKEPVKVDNISPKEYFLNKNSNENAPLLDRIKILESKNLILSNKVKHLDQELLNYINKYNALLKASKEEINRVVDARKLLASDCNYKKDLFQLGLVSKEEHDKVSDVFEKLSKKYYDLKDDYDFISRKLNNILSKNL
jgi:hypothetical protein